MGLGPELLLGQSKERLGVRAEGIGGGSFERVVEVRLHLRVLSLFLGELFLEPRQLDGLGPEFNELDGERFHLFAKRLFANGRHLLLRLHLGLRSSLGKPKPEPHAEGRRKQSDERAEEGKVHFGSLFA